MNDQREELYDTRSCARRVDGRWSVATLMREETSVALARAGSGESERSGASMWPLALFRVFAKFSPQRQPWEVRATRLQHGRGLKAETWANSVE